MKIQQVPTILSATLVLVACAAPPAANEEPVSVDDWTQEDIALPPGFAPTLPTGVESLRFSPGWRDPESESWWCYAFAMWIDEPVPSSARIDEIFEAYYDGLISTVASSNGRDVGDDPATVRVTHLEPGLYRATVDMIDAFGSFEPITIHMRIEAARAVGQGSVLRVQACRHRDGHPMWKTLEAVVRQIDRPGD